MSRLVADENFPLDVVAALRKLGHDILTIREIGQANIGWPDDEVFLFAQGQGRTILTLNRNDFYRLHSFHPNHFGIIACTENRNYSEATARIHQTLLQNVPLNGKFLRVYQSSSSKS